MLLQTECCAHNNEDIIIIVHLCTSEVSVKTIFNGLSRRISIYYHAKKFDTGTPGAKNAMFRPALI